MANHIWELSFFWDTLPPMLFIYVDENITLSLEAVLMKKSPCNLKVGLIKKSLYKWKRDCWNNFRVRGSRIDEKTPHKLMPDWWKNYHISDWWKNHIVGGRRIDEVKVSLLLTAKAVGALFSHTRRLPLVSLLFWLILQPIPIL